MFIFTAKIAKEKIAIGALAAVAVIVLLVLLIGGGGDDGDATETIGATGVSSNDDRLAYITSLGWAVKETPLETMEVMIPQDQSEVFARYNELQKSQGFDLSKYAGKKVKKITYEVLNHPSGEEGVKLTLLIYKKEIIGGDVASGKEGGFMHSLEMPQDAGVTGAEAEAIESPEPSPAVS